MDPIRVLIVDDHPFYREGVRTMLSVESGIEIAGEVASGDEAIAQAASLQPDVILMDLKMPASTALKLLGVSCTPARISGCWSSPCLKPTSRSLPPCAQAHEAICSRM